MPRRPPGTAMAVGATLLAALVWGTSFSVNDLGLAHVGPATFALLRFALAGAATLLVAALLRRLDVAPLRDPRFWLLAAFNGLGFFLQYVGQTMTTPARTALFVNTSAFFVALLDRLLFRTHLGAGRVAALVLGVAGAALLVTGGDLGSLHGGRFLGDLVVLVAGFAWSFYFVMNRRAVQGADPLNVMAWTFTLTSLLLVPTLLLDPAPLHVPLPGAAAIAYSGLVTTALAFGLWAYGLQGIGATASSVLLLVEILVAALVSAGLGRESFGAWDYAGAGLLVAAVLAMGLLEARQAAPAQNGK